MTVEFSTHLGQIDVAAEVIETLAGKAALECYGLLGMASNKQIQDGIFELLGKDNFRRGVIVREDDQGVHIDLYIVVIYGIKISEVSTNVQNKVKYSLEETLGLKVQSVNIYVKGVKDHTI